MQIICFAYMLLKCIPLYFAYVQNKGQLFYSKELVHERYLNKDIS